MKTLIILLSFSLQLRAENIYISGELESKNIQHVYMPFVPNYNAILSELAAEGSYVNPGDVLVRIDGSSISAQLQTQIDELENQKTTAEKSEIEAQIQLNTAQINHETNKINYAIAQMEAQVPEDFIGELKYKQNQLALKNSEKAHKKAINDLQEQKSKIEDNHKKITLGLAQKQKKLDYLTQTLDNLTIRAQQQGYVIYVTHPWSGGKIQQGDMIQIGMNILDVAQNSDWHITAKVNAIDIPHLALNQVAQIKFDAFLDNSYKARISSIASGGSENKIWGDGLYYEVTFDIDDSLPENLLLGMSVQIKIETEEAKP